MQTFHKSGILSLGALTSCILLPLPSLAGTKDLLSTQTVYDARCLADVPPYVKNAKNQDPNQTPVSITADHADADLRHSVNYSGNVEIVQGQKTLKADNTSFNHETQDIMASGDIFYQDGEVTVKSDTTLTTNLKTNDTRLDKATYRLNGTLVRGYADEAVIKDQANRVSLRNAYITTCPEDQETWKISSSEIEMDKNEVFGEAYNTVFWFHNIPVLYLPYLNFPVKNQRKSGLLYPVIGWSSSDEILLKTPVYWNIAPNYDMTITPTLIGRRGLLMESEFRYLPFAGTQGSMMGQYIHHDRKSRDDKEPDKFHERWLYTLNHKSYWDNRNFGLEADYTRIRSGDFNYIDDFDPTSVNTIDNQLLQEARAFVNLHNFDASVRMLRYQLLIPDSLLLYQPFRIEPELKMGYHNTMDSWFSYNLGMTYSNFRVDGHSRDTGYDAQRIHFEPEITVPLVDYRGINLTFREKLFYTHYDQNIPHSRPLKYPVQILTADEMKPSTDRFLNLSEIRGKVTFTNTLDSGHTLTLEPEVQYIYIPYKNQEAIGLYDTLDRVYDFDSLFSYRKYSGLDRISDANRLSYGLTHRIYDQEFREVLRFQIGQGYDFTAQRVKLFKYDDTNYYRRTPISTALNVSPFKGISAHGDLVYDTEYSQLSSWSGLVNGEYEEFKGQLNYRYKKDGTRTMKNDVIDLRQLGGSLQVPLSRDWHAIGVMYYDLFQKKNIDQKLAVKYDSCCYSLGVQVERYNRPDNYTMTADNETKFGVFFELKGLANVGADTSFTTETKLLPYNDTVNLSK